MIAVVLLTGTAELWHLIVLSAVRGTGAAFFFPASTGLVPQTVSPERLQAANAVLRLSNSATFVLGAAVGGLVVAALGSGWAIAFDSLTFLGSAAFLAVLHIPQGERAPATSFVHELRVGWAEFSSRTWLWAIVVEFSFVNAFASGAWQVLGPVVSKTSLGGASSWGLILTGQAVGLILGGLVALRYKPERPLLVASLAIPLSVPAYLLLAAEAPLLLVALAAALIGVSVEIFTVLWDTALRQHVPGQALSRVSAYDWLGSLVLLPVGFVIVGPIAERIGVSETLVAAGGVVVAGTLAVLCVGDVRRLRRTDTEPEGAAMPAA